MIVYVLCACLRVCDVLQRVEEAASVLMVLTNTLLLLLTIPSHTLTPQALPLVLALM